LTEAKTIEPIITKKIGRKMTRKKSFHFGGNSNHITSALWLGMITVMVGWIWASDTPRQWTCFTGRSFNSNDYSRSAALAGVRALLSAVLHVLNLFTLFHFYITLHSLSRSRHYCLLYNIRINTQMFCTYLHYT